MATDALKPFIEKVLQNGEHNANILIYIFEYKYKIIISDILIENEFL
jgi:hypothetical protein